MTDVVSTATNPATNTDADRALKAKHRAMWAFGDYAALASDIIWTLGPILVEATGVQRGDRVLDVGAGSGNAALPAARTGATVVASDLTPELLETGRGLAEQEGLTLDWRQADAEALPFADNEFDVAMSCVGVMFAPHHQASADELLRVLRPGGRLGLLSWTPEGLVGQMFATMKPYSPPPPPGAQPPPLWGSEQHLLSLFGDRITGVTARKQTVRMDRFGSGAEFRDYFKARYGPTIAVYKFIGDDTDKVAALDRDLAELGDRLGAGGPAFDWEYLLFTARKA